MKVCENKIRGETDFEYKEATNEVKVDIRSPDSDNLARKPLLPIRWVVVVLGTVGTGLVFCLRVNISVSILAMVNTTAIAEQEAKSHAIVTNDSSIEIVFNPLDRCFVNTVESNSSTPNNREESSLKEGDLVWNQAIQGVVLGAYYYGYATSQIIGGRFAEKFGGRWIGGSGILISALATLLTPLAAEVHLALAIIIRIIVGIAHGSVYTSLYVMLSLWFPRQERATALAFITVGGNVGAALTLPFCSHLIVSDGWPSTFYITGVFGIIWFIFWIYFVRNFPSEHPYITASELDYIQSGLDPMGSKKSKAPWKHIFRCPSVWAIAVAKSCGMFGYYMLSTKLPSYLESVLNMPMQKNGYINALTYVAVSITMTISGPLSDYIKRNYNVSLTLLRKIFETIALLGTSLCLALIPLMGCDENAVIILLLLSMFSYGFTTGGDIPIVADIAPHFVGTIFGVTNTISSSMGILSPIVVGLFLENNHRSISQWSKAFYFSAGLGVIGNIAFCWWTTAVAQEWGLIQEQTKTKDTIDGKQTDKCEVDVKTVSSKVIIEHSFRN